MTFLDLYNAVIRSVYPEKVARNIAPIVKDWVRDALIDLQKKVTQLQAGNVQVFPQSASYYTCGLTAIPAPRGYIKNVTIRHSAVANCPSTDGVPVSKQEMLAMRDACPCSAYPSPLNQGVTGQYRLRIPDPTIDRINRQSYRYVSMFDGYIWWYPWINSNEELVVEWKGEKRSWEDSDLIPSSFLDERGSLDREVQMLIELYVTANKDILFACKPRDVAVAMYNARLSRYIISRNDQDRLDLDPPFTPVCKTYCSPPLAVATAKWPTPVFSEADVARWPGPSISEEDYELPITPQATAPTISPNSGGFIGVVIVTITSSMSAPFEIRYTLDGSTPTASSTLYTGPIAISGTTTVKAIVVKTGFLNSAVAQRSYTLVVPDVDPVMFSPADSSFIGSLVVTMSTATPGPYQIRYTIDGSDPIASSALYSGPVTISSSATFKAIVVKSGYRTIAPSTKSYTQIVPAVAPVSFTPTNPNFIDTVNVALATTTPLATIRYTTNGSDPSELSPIYTAPLSVSSNTTVKAKAFKSGYTDSSVTTKAFVKVIPVEVTFDRFEFATVIWNAKTAAIGSGTTLRMVVEGTACTFNVKYGGASIFGPLSMGIDGTHENTLSMDALLSGGYNSIEISGLGESYFRLAGETTGYTVFKFYVY